MNSILYVRLPCQRVYPGGVVALADYVHKSCPDIKQKILDLSPIAINSRKKTLIDELTSFNPDIIAFSWRDIQIFAPHQNDDVVANAFKFFYSSKPTEKIKASFQGIKAVFQYDKSIKDNLKLIKLVSGNFPDKKIVVGGSAFSVFPEQLIEKCPEGTIGIVGEGELALHSIIKEEDIYQHKVMVKQNSRIIRGKRSTYLDVSKSKPTNFSYIAGIFPQFNSYLNDYIGIQTKRGCTQKCLFCLYRIIEGTKIRYRNPEVVGQEVEDLYRNFGVRKIWLTDATFCPDKVSMSFCENVLDEFINRDLDIEWQGYIRIENLTQELAKKMLDSGISAFELSLTSGSQKIVDGLKLGFDYDKIWQACEMIKNAGYKNQPIIINYALNAPGETEETLKESISNLKKFQNLFGQDNVQPFIFFLAVQSNTGLEKIAIKQKFLPRKYNKLSLSPNLVKGLIYNPPPLDKMIARTYLEASSNNNGKNNLGNEMFRILEENLAV